VTNDVRNSTLVRVHMYVTLLSMSSSIADHTLCIDVSVTFKVSLCEHLLVSATVPKLHSGEGGGV